MGVGRTAKILTALAYLKLALDHLRIVEQSDGALVSDTRFTFITELEHGGADGSCARTRDTLGYGTQSVKTYTSSVRRPKD